MLTAETISLVVQVNGKRRDQIEVAADTPEDELKRLARASEWCVARSTARRSSRRSSSRDAWSTSSS